MATYAYYMTCIICRNTFSIILQKISTIGGFLLSSTISYNYCSICHPDEVAQWLECLGLYQGDRWFESRRRLFAEKPDYFMIFEVYPAVRVRLQARERY